MSHFCRPRDHTEICLRNQVSLELVQIDVEGTVKAKGSGDRGDDLGNQAVEVGEAGRDDVELLLADVVDCFVVDLSVP